jgi:CRISPR-associated exonuclease Cas4
MMGDRDYRSLIKNVIDSIGKEVDIKIDSGDNKAIHLSEVVQCLRRSYFDRTSPQEIDRSGFNDLLAGLLRKLHYGVEAKEFEINDIKLKGQSDMIVDDAVILFRSASSTVPSNPKANDLLYLNACLWIYNKMDGIIIYITDDRKEVSFSLTKDKKMFEETVRRVKVLSSLLDEKKEPILEPSEACDSCQYYQKCYINEKIGKSFLLKDLIGLNK